MCVVSGQGAEKEPFGTLLCFKVPPCTESAIA